MRLAVGVAAVLMVGMQAAAAPPSLDERIAARRAVEEVLWRHRTWPADNAQPKPPLSAVLSDAEIRARVVDDLRKSKALEVLWHRTVTAAMLAAELDRMRGSSRSPELLEEMFAAVGNDPALEREAIARPALVDRLVRSWYAHDGRYHAEVERQAAARSGGIVTEWTASADEVTSGLDRLVDEDDAYRIYTLKERKGDALTFTVRSWPKRPFDAFWSETASTLEPSLAVPADDSLPRIQPEVASCSNDTWRPLGGATPGPRYSHSAVWTGTEMIVFGGWTPGGVTASGGRYVPATDSWYVLPAAGAPSARLGHPAVWTGSAMVIWGGQQSIASPYGTLGDGAVYSPATDAWTPIAAANAPSARRDHTMIWAGSRVVVFGGQNDGSTTTNTGGRYDPSTDTWAPTTTTGAPSARRGHTAVWTGSQMIVWGGSGNVSVNTGGRYDPVADAWTPTSTTGAPQVRLLHSAVWTGSRMVVWGGESSTGFYLDSGGRYDPSTDSWTATSTVNVAATRIQHATVWTGTEMIVWGGWLEQMGTERANGGRYNPATDTWTAVTSTSAPERRRSLSGVWTGTEMIVWGGVWELGSPQPLIQYLNNGGRYAPASDSWVPTSIEDFGPPSFRQYHTATWTGAETVIWGGNVFNDGGRYVAATDSWFPTTTTNAPAPRTSHTAIWTGSEVVVWGGYDTSLNPLNTGGRYSPSSDTWTATATAGAPPAVSLHTAVWTGSRMVVWGGTTAATTSNQGGRYDPATNTWSATSTASAPTGRYDHTAVWTGSTMVIWGGSEQFNDTSAPVSTGGRYDPVADTWTATSTTGAPQGRVAHAAVWTGSRMLVWGGSCCNGALFGDGGSYDPVGNAWSPIASAGAPAPRAYSQAAWTGLEMIVWGGINGVRLNTGGRYDGANDVWSAPTTAGAPAARDAHTVTWAGNELLVFGGTLANGGPTDTGATYCACTNVYRDLDGDGYGNPLDTTSSCDGTIPPGYIARGGDCNDGNASIHPGASDNTCNGVDEDCNGIADDMWIGGISHCGLGVCASTGFFTCDNGQINSNCTPGTPTSSSDTVCNGLDDDCDGQTDEDYVQRPDHWVATANASTSRSSHTAVWSGTEMIVFGGDDGSGGVRAGGQAYAAASDTWRTLPTGPTARHTHTAVWTGSKMVVWGGNAGTTIFNTGGRYDPSTDSWATTSTVNAPSARGGHTAVWTGSRMVVWGGSDSVNTFNTGSRYDAVANSWSAMTTTGAPAARVFHTAVWTGTQMIVWGGQTSPTGSAVATGGRYDPSADSWTTMAASPLSARYGNVAVWTGTEMLIWGGTDGSGFRVNGARYSPSSNTWTAMSLTGAPSARAYASAAWTGTELIVWGGDGAAGVKNDGARYNPATDTWTAMTPESVPSARRHASGVWTGDTFIVWGGDNGTSATQSGSRYLPQTVCGTGGCQRSGSTVCSGGVISYQCVPQPPSPEVCDGLDNDCNTLIDDGIPVPSGHPVLTLSKNATPWNTVQTWTAVPGATAYDTVGGMLSALRSSSGNYSTSVDSCLFNDLPDTAFQDAILPSPGDGEFYLVRPVNACSGNGSYNDNVSRDAGINASPAACP